VDQALTMSGGSERGRRQPRPLSAGEDH
jgi:hypothetical protein